MVKKRTARKKRKRRLRKWTLAEKRAHLKAIDKLPHGEQVLYLARYKLTTSHVYAWRDQVWEADNK